jgi:RNA polymerase sigma-70 factor (ECF subfamily)
MTAWRSDEELMLRYRGENSAFEMLYHRHEKPLFDFIYRTVMDAAETENLCQEAFSRVVRTRRNYRATQGTLTPWDPFPCVFAFLP